MNSIIQPYLSQNQRIKCFYIVVFSTIVMIIIATILFQQRLYRPVNSSDMLWLTLRNIKTDGRLLWEKQILYYDRSFVGIQKDISWKQEIHKFLAQVSPYFRNRSICADNWAVTVDATKEVLETARRLSDWCIVVVVGDQQYPDKIGENVFLLNKTIRYELAKISAFYKESLLLPNDRYTVLKNLGYLWAIFHEATVIWDFDIAPDMVLNEHGLQVSLNETVEALHVLHHNNTLFNPHLFFISEWKHVWPRGYPFKYTYELPKRNHQIETSKNILPAKNLGVINSLTEGYVETGFQYELVRPVLPLHFYTAYTLGYKNIKLFVPHRSFSPYGQQGTIHFRSALWALLLPVTIEQKVSDIFRSYVMQRLMWDVDLRIAFVGSFFTSEGAHRNLPVYFCCLLEKEYYWKVDKIIQFLTQWSTNQTGFVERVEQLFITLYEHGHIQMLDVHLTLLWLQELYQIGYIFPEITSN